MDEQMVELIADSQIQQLKQYLAANVDIRRVDGQEHKGQAYQEMLDTVIALQQLAAQPLQPVAKTLDEGQSYRMPELTRVTLVNQKGIAFEDYDLYPTGPGFHPGAELMIQDQGRTLKVSHL